MLRLAILLAASLVSHASASAAVFTFTTDPFAGSTALATPGRQVVGGEPSITFLPGADVFAFDEGAFAPYGFGPPLNVVNAAIGSVPVSGANVIVLRTFDDDANSATPFGAGNAASLLAARITAQGAGFFVYFNSGLNLPRLVFSTNLDDPTADLRIMARMTNLTGVDGRAVLSDFSFREFATTVPEPTSLLLLSMAGAMAALRRRRI